MFCISLLACPCSGQQYSVSSYCYVLVVCCLHHFWLVLKFQGSGYVMFLPHVLKTCALTYIGQQILMGHCYWRYTFSKMTLKYKFMTLAVLLLKLYIFSRHPTVANFHVRHDCYCILMCEILIETSGLQSSPEAIINCSMARLDCGI